MKFYPGILEVNDESQSPLEKLLSKGYQYALDTSILYSDTVLGILHTQVSWVKLFTE